MKTFGNILWLIFIGWWYAFTYFVLGALLCVTILFIPIGIQFFKMARLAFWPFGYRPVYSRPTGFNFVINIIWCILGGWECALSCYLTGIVLCCTIIFIPCGIQMFKFGKLNLLPIGTTIEKI